jgi:hypothetical protein
VIAFYVDYNVRERLSDGGQAVFIAIGRMNPPGLEKRFKIGLQITLYDEETACLGILRRAMSADDWVADIVPGTVRDIPESEFRQLRVATKRAALNINR